jgi:hypothetical protein
MKSKIFLSIVTLLIGTFTGYFVQLYKDRANPILQISSISFERIEKNDLKIEIDDDLQEMSFRSKWFKTLGNKESYPELIDLVTDDLSETVTALEGMTSDLPKMKRYVQQHKNDLSVEQAKSYRLFLRDNVDTLSLTYFAINIQGMIQTGEVDLEITGDLTLKSTTPSIDKSFQEIDEATNENEDMYAMLALQISYEWHPADLLKALDVAIDQIGEQATLNANILYKINELIKENVENLMNDYLLVTASISNNGNKTISFQKYGIVSLSGMDVPIFLEAFETEGAITLRQGSTEEIKLKSRQSLPPELSKKLRTMYNSDFIKCKIGMRLLTVSKLSSEWAYSRAVSLSGFNQKLKSEYVKNAPKIDFN